VLASPFIVQSPLLVHPRLQPDGPGPSSRAQAYLVPSSAAKVVSLVLWHSGNWVVFALVNSEEHGKERVYGGRGAACREWRGPAIKPMPAARYCEYKLNGGLERLKEHSLMARGASGQRCCTWSQETNGAAHGLKRNFSVSTKKSRPCSEMETGTQD
jgi:hypothetical protein